MACEWKRLSPHRTQSAQSWSLRNASEKLNKNRDKEVSKARASRFYLPLLSWTIQPSYGDFSRFPRLYFPHLNNFKDGNKGHSPHITRDPRSSVYHPLKSSSVIQINPLRDGAGGFAENGKCAMFLVNHVGNSDQCFLNFHVLPGRGPPGVENHCNTEQGIIPRNWTHCRCGRSWEVSLVSGIEEPEKSHWGNILELWRVVKSQLSGNPGSQREGEGTWWRLWGAVASVSGCGLGGVWWVGLTGRRAGCRVGERTGWTQRCAFWVPLQLRGSSGSTGHRPTSFSSIPCKFPTGQLSFGTFQKAMVSSSSTRTIIKPPQMLHNPTGAAVKMQIRMQSLWAGPEIAAFWTHSRWGNCCGSTGCTWSSNSLFLSWKGKKMHSNEGSE